MPVSKSFFFVTCSNVWEFVEIHRYIFGEKCQKFDLFAYPFRKKTFNPDINVYLIFMMLQINKTKHFLNLAEKVLFMQF